MTGLSGRSSVHRDDCGEVEVPGDVASRFGQRLDTQDVRVQGGIRSLSAQGALSEPRRVVREING